MQHDKISPGRVKIRARFFLRVRGHETRTPACEREAAVPELGVSRICRDQKPPSLGMSMEFPRDSLTSVIKGSYIASSLGLYGFLFKQQLVYRKLGISAHFPGAITSDFRLRCNRTSIHSEVHNPSVTDIVKYILDSLESGATVSTAFLISARHFCASTTNSSGFPGLCVGPCHVRTKFSRSTHMHDSFGHIVMFAVIR
ncbi:hypothetical protein J6590_035825, partial [Homalodisca vitripennis]